MGSSVSRIVSYERSTILPGGGNVWWGECVDVGGVTLEES